jgi:hypothetical protein
MDDLELAASGVTVRPGLRDAKPIIIRPFEGGSHTTAAAAV